MVSMAFPDDGSNRAFLVLQPGRVMVFPNDQAAPAAQEFLDIRARVNDRGNEEGLLGLAFDPQFSSSGYFFVYYTASDPRRSVVSRFTVMADDPDRADATSERVVLEIAQPFSNHNGGQLQFGPDGYLYISVGDGGSGGDPNGNGQDLSTLRGAILRIDVRALGIDGGYAVPRDNPFVGREGALPEIWAYGLRNPWRFSFDRSTDDLWAGDVGQNRFEEVDLIVPGGNYGWNRMEGFHCYPRPEASCDQEGLELPVAEYGHDEGCSVTGGYVYRGRDLPSLHGSYLYGDFCSGKIWAFRHDGGGVVEQLEIADTAASISSFAQDLSGELYILSFDGKIYRIVP
jgi:glucose/arabinose dehydrogenase